MVDSESHVFIQFVRPASHHPWWVTAAGALALVACASGCSASSSGSSPDTTSGNEGGAVDGGATPVDSGSQADWSVQPLDSGSIPYEASPQPDAGGGGDSSDPDLQCYGQSADACYQCCVNNHPSGSMIYENAFYDCVCGPPNGTQAVCQTQCAQTDCSSAADAGAPMTGDPCDTCETQATGDGGACVSSLNTACGASADCLAFSNCQDNCP